MRPSQVSPLLLTCPFEPCGKNTVTTCKMPQRLHFTGGVMNRSNSNAPSEPSQLDSPKLNKSLTLICRPDRISVPILDKIREPTEVDPMQNCSACAQLEQMLESTAKEHWNVIHKYRSADPSVRDSSGVEQLLAQTKAAIDEAQRRYEEHLALSHAKPQGEKP